MTSRRVGLAIAALVLAGCATITPADYRETFARVIRKSLDASKDNNVCLPPLYGSGNVVPDTVEVPLEIDPIVRAPQGRLAQFRALEAAGLVKGVEEQKTVGNRVQRVATFRRTDAGAAFFSNHTFCYAHAELAEVVKWKGPIVLGQYQAAFVYYTARTSRVADWARHPAVTAAFPTVAATLGGETPKVRTVALDLSSEGWDVAEYSKLLTVE